MFVRIIRDLFAAWRRGPSRRESIIAFLIRHIFAETFPYGETSALLDRLRARMVLLTDSLNGGFESLERLLSVREIRIARGIREGMTSKAIAQNLGISPRTVECHRSHLRRKLGIRHRPIHLRSYLLSLDD
ncbi:MAG: response regulator transcription factor [Desulfobacterales bacterium]